MANFGYSKAKAEILDGDIDFTGDDIRVLLVMSNTTADTEKDVDTISAFSTLDECDDGSYARQALANEAVAEDEANDRGEFDAYDASFTLAGDGSRDIVGAVVYKHVTNDADSIPIAYIDDVDAIKTMVGTLTVQWNAEGILQIT